MHVFISVAQGGLSPRNEFILEVELDSYRKGTNFEVRKTEFVTGKIT